MLYVCDLRALSIIFVAAATSWDASASCRRARPNSPPGYAKGQSTAAGSLANATSTPCSHRYPDAMAACKLVTPASAAVCALPDHRHLAYVSVPRRPAASTITGIGYKRNRTLSLYEIAFRSEEHTSELQSLMRISYAVFCLKKKTQDHNH